MSELKPCPFCGGEARIFALQIGKGWRVVCSKPFCAQGPNGDTEAEAIAAWNSRAERTCEFIEDSDSEPLPPKCSVCGYDPGIYECAWYEDGTYGYERNYCPNCGSRVIA